ncbi:MAG: IS5 family transposase [Thermomicrobia bacterium]|nr:IS5 family transposase [Thermomicrobia bacterium]
MELTDEQWARLDPLIPEPPRRADGRGRPWTPRRAVLDGVLWILRTGAQWKDLPERYPPHTTVHRRFQTWVRDGTLEWVLAALATDLQERGGIDVSECFVDGTFVGAKKGAHVLGKTKRGKGTKLMAVADRVGLPIAVCTASASPHEVTLVDAVLKARFVEPVPERLIGDKAYDSDPLDARLAAQGIAMIAPHRKNRRKPQTQDGRVLRRYKRRWKIERMFAWLGNFRRLVVRYERHVANYTGFVHLGCILILLRQDL